MKSNLLQELQQILERKERMQVALPIPTYLFVQRYGRSIEPDMEEIAKLLGKEKWFSFKTGHMENNQSILGKFLLEQECQTSFGKEYEGCVLVELSGEEDTRELAEFLDYTGQQKQRLCCIFTTKEMERVQELQKQLSEDCFVRVIKGSLFEVQEQIELFARTLESYQLKLEEEAKQELAEFFEKREWQEEEAVEIKILNMVKTIVYEKFLTESMQDMEVGREDILEAVSKMEEKTVKKRQIGFVQEA